MSITALEHVSIWVSKDKKNELPLQSSAFCSSAVTLTRLSFFALIVGVLSIAASASSYARSAFPEMAFGSLKIAGYFREAIPVDAVSQVGILG